MAVKRKIAYAKAPHRLVEGSDNIELVDADLAVNAVHRPLSPAGES